VKSVIVTWLSGALLCLHLVGIGILATVIWEQSVREVPAAQSASNYLRLLAKDICRTVPTATRR
jgi:hypothetical protein